MFFTGACKLMTAAVVKVLPSRSLSNCLSTLCSPRPCPPHLSWPHAHTRSHDSFPSPWDRTPSCRLQCQSSPRSWERGEGEMRGYLRDESDVWSGDKRRSSTTSPQVSLSISLVLAVSEWGVKGGESQEAGQQRREEGGWDKRQAEGGEQELTRIWRNADGDGRAEGSLAGWRSISSSSV